ncbi:MAG: MBL fold metallo-hydrolase [Proteobacteria bacterium]|nr:MBL fold metallo-hydrolase [Pseudomonadota bacterium]
MKLRYWGTRGSFAMSGADYLRYGGNTTAVEFVAANGRRLLIDLGTGVTELAKQLLAAEFGEGKGELPILLTHTHLDHIQGLPFFTPFFVKGNRISIMGAEPIGISLTDVFQNQLNPHYSPLNGLENLAAGVTVHTIYPGNSLPVEGFEVSTASVPHGGMWTTAFRITADGTTVVFLSDVEYPESVPTVEALALAKGADLLIHDAMFSEEEYRKRHGWGHSSVNTAIEVAERADVARLALFHHNPDSVDTVIDAMVEHARERTSVPLYAAAEGTYIEP